MPTSLHNLEQLLEHIAGLAKNAQQVSMAQVVDSVGDRSFGPLLLIIGLTLFSPLSGVPGIATFSGMFIVLIALQMLLGRKSFWLPGFMLNRSIAQDRLTKAIDWLKPSARRIDRLIKPRLNCMLHSSSTYLIAALCVLIGVALPFLELVPFSSSILGLAMAILGLALVARDGLLVLIALAVIGAGGSLAFVKLL